MRGSGSSQAKLGGMLVCRYGGASVAGSSMNAGMHECLNVDF